MHKTGCSLLGGGAFAVVSGVRVWKVLEVTMNEELFLNV